MAKSSNYPPTRPINSMDVYNDHHSSTLPSSPVSQDISSPLIEMIETDGPGIRSIDSDRINTTPARQRQGGPSILEDLHSVQQERSMKLYRYQSSPDKTSPQKVSSSPLRIASSPSRGPINLRNKHNKLQQVRNQHRQERLDLLRDRVSDIQSTQDMTRMYEQQYQAEYEGLDWDKLIEEEEEVKEEDYEAYIEDYEKDLEAQADLDDLEIAEMIAQLEL